MGCYYTDKVRIIGLQRSGTTWLECLMANNYQVKVSNRGKHNLPTERQEIGRKLRESQEPVLLIMKRFDKWIDSIKRMPVTLPKMRPEMYYNGALGIAKAKATHDNFYDQWLVSGCNLYFVGYTDLLKSPTRMLASIAHRFGFKRSSTEWNLSGPQNYNDGGKPWDKTRREFYLAQPETESKYDSPAWKGLCEILNKPREHTTEDSDPWVSIAPVQFLDD